MHVLAIQVGFQCIHRVNILNWENIENEKGYPAFLLIIIITACSLYNCPDELIEPDMESITGNTEPENTIEPTQNPVITDPPVVTNPPVITVPPGYTDDPNEISISEQFWIDRQDTWITPIDDCSCYTPMIGEFGADRSEPGNERSHAGTDLYVPEGTEVLAMIDGEVIEVI